MGNIVDLSGAAARTGDLRKKEGKNYKEMRRYGVY